MQPTQPQPLLKTLANDAVDGLMEYHAVLTDARDAAIGHALNLVEETGNNQSDYEALRDGIEAWVCIQPPLDDRADGKPWKLFQTFRESQRARIAELAARADRQRLDEAHWDLVVDMKDALGSMDANQSGDGEQAQEAAIDDAESWVTDNLSHGGDEATVAMAAWLLGFDEAERRMCRTSGTGGR